MRRAAIVLVSIYTSTAAAFTTIAHGGIVIRNNAVMRMNRDEGLQDKSQKSMPSRRDVMQSATGAVLSSSLLIGNLNEAYAAGLGADEAGLGADETIMYKTPSGLQYREVRIGTGPSPKYGQFCTFSYKAYISLAGDDKSKKPQMFDEAKSYLTKHGNGRLVAGLDEGLHTMKVGGVRRIIVPPKLGYVEAGIGPIPIGWYARFSLNGLLDKMVERQGGRVIFDVELKQVMDDEADQGYYDDESISPEDFATLRNNMQGSRASGRGMDPLIVDKEQGMVGEI